MSELGRMGISALKSMEKGLKPLVKSVDTLQNKINALTTERDSIQARIDNLTHAMNEYAGGDYKAVLYPEVVSAEVTDVEFENNVDEEPEKSWRTEDLDNVAKE